MDVFDLDQSLVDDYRRFARSSNDEERQRQGFEIQTVFAWPRRDGAIDVVRPRIEDEDGEVASLDYATGAIISRLNKGLRRRKNRTWFGFGIDPASGRWAGMGSAGDDADDGTTAPVRVAPIVQDDKNAALMRLADEARNGTTLATLQHALARGLEIVFQLEEGEVLTEAVPSRENRRAVFTYEATEGGAGVLERLVSEPDALRRVAKTALSIMHFENVEAAASSADPALLRTAEDANCVSGCYRCLLSYDNQPDHELIDRRDEAALRTLLRFARGTMGNIESSAEPAREDARRAAVPALVWRSHLAIGVFGPLPDSVRAALSACGYAFVLLSERPGSTVPPQRSSLLTA
jgi:hypothetical protein